MERCTSMWSDVFMQRSFNRFNSPSENSEILKRRNKMKSTHVKLWLVVAALAVIGLAQEAKANTGSQNIDIHVSVNATKSVAVDNNSYTFPAIPVSSAAVSASSITVTNDSNGVVETYAILGATAITAGNDV